MLSVVMPTHAASRALATAVVFVVAIGIGIALVRIAVGALGAEQPSIAPIELVPITGSSTSSSTTVSSTTTIDPHPDHATARHIANTGARAGTCAGAAARSATATPGVGRRRRPR